MAKISWEVIETVSGDLKAEILRGLLEAQGVPVVLSQEGAGRSVFHVTVGPLGEVEIFVPSGKSQLAREVIADFYAGAFEVKDEGNEEDISGNLTDDAEIN